MKNVAFLYIVGAFLASACAVGISFLVPTELVLGGVEKASQSSPAFMSEIFKDLILKIIDNPISALSSGDYLGILAWVIAGEVALRHYSREARQVFVDINEGALRVMQFVAELVPFGILGLVANFVASTGVAGPTSYAKSSLALVRTMLFVAFVINALVVSIYMCKDPLPFIFICLRESALFTFFAHNSAANILINVALCAKPGIDKELYSISIPFGVTINMGGAAVTTTALSLATAHTAGIEVSFFRAFLLGIIATSTACEASEAAGDSLLLISLTCSLFNISYDVVMKIMAVGFIIDMMQDNVETTFNSSTDVFFTAICSKDDLYL